MPEMAGNVKVAEMLSSTIRNRLNTGVIETNIFNESL